MVPQSAAALRDIFYFFLNTENIICLCTHPNVLWCISSSCQLICYTTLSLTVSLSPLLQVPQMADSSTCIKSKQFRSSSFNFKGKRGKSQSLCILPSAQRQAICYVTLPLLWAFPCFTCFRRGWNTWKCGVDLRHDALELGEKKSGWKTKNVALFLSEPARDKSYLELSWKDETLSEVKRSHWLHGDSQPQLRDCQNTCISGHALGVSGNTSLWYWSQGNSS